jgi:hypothetical protein
LTHLDRLGAAAHRRKMVMDDRPKWFAPKRYGFGAGLPISWQGWLVLAFYVAIVVAAGSLLDHRLAQASIVVLATALLVIIFAKTTRGGWRWRWGDPD